MTSRKGKWVVVDDWTCKSCEGHGAIQWVEGLGPPIECPACKGVGFRKTQRWVDSKKEVKDD